MFKRILREYFLFSPGERRALFLISLILLISLLVRLALPIIPRREPPGMDLFREEALRLRAELALLDSLDKKAGDKADAAPPKAYPSPSQDRGLVYSTLNPCEINSADSADLLPLPGIGPVFARRIIRYRELLGGYIHPDQILEVYGMDSSRYLPIRNILVADTLLVQKMEVNSAHFSTLLRHPYLEYEDVLELVQFRDQIGKIMSFEQLSRNGILMDSTRNSVRQYLKFVENRH